MRIIRGLESYPSDAAPAALALGIFDGVHLGHRAILDAAVRSARGAGLRAVACTFDPHPMDVLQPQRAPAPIASLEERLALIAEQGIDATVVLRFTLELARMEPEAFVKDILHGRLRAQQVVVGYNHTFGRGARGDARLLEELAPRLGFAATVVPPLVIDGVPVSSSEIRNVLRAGDVARAARYLGRPYRITGKVVRGAGRGRGLGFPTANVQPERPLLVPAGVYACRARVGDRDEPAVVNIGVRPTFGETVLAVEAYLLDFSGDLYGLAMSLAFVERLRSEQRFPTVDALLAQIAADVEHARRVL
jgi:riboflavin kinase/FMN adenylyltransferase